MHVDCAKSKINAFLYYFIYCGKLLNSGQSKNSVIDISQTSQIFLTVVRVELHPFLDIMFFIVDLGIPPKSQRAVGLVFNLPQ